MDDVLKRAIDLREQRKNIQKSHDKLIRDLRVYYTGLPTKALYPYDYQYSEIFLNILRNKALMCPLYHHLYIQVEKTVEECLKRSIPIENWYVYGIASIDYDDYMKRLDKAKDEIVLETIITGLKDIADIDSLDQSIINSTIDEIRKTGLDTELTHLTTENQNIKAVVTYFSRSMEEGNPIYLTVNEKSSGRFGRKQIGTAEKEQLYFWISKLTLNTTSVKIKAKGPSDRADWHLKDKPRSMEFSIEEILNG
ncbi:MAG TPA: hypothetical protein VHE59_01910 [Mucilaginibacter sp.]|nr:hypothetical protein [Mucilaginibacter sp.]